MGGPSSTPGSGRSSREGIAYPLQHSWASLVAQLVKNPPAMWETWVQFLVGKILWRRDKLSTPALLGFPCGSAGKESTCNAGSLGLILGWKNPLEMEKATHSSILAWRIPWTIHTVHGVTKSQTRLSDFHFHFVMYLQPLPSEVTEHR